MSGGETIDMSIISIEIIELNYIVGLILPTAQWPLSCKNF